MIDDDWKPRIDYYDYFAQNSEEKPIRQTFPFVKVCFHSSAISHSMLTNEASFLHLHKSGALEGFDRVIIVSDGGIGLIN